MKFILAVCLHTCWSNSVVQIFRASRNCDAGGEQCITGASTGDVKQLAFSTVDFLQIGVVSSRIIASSQTIRGWETSAELGQSVLCIDSLQGLIDSGARTNCSTPGTEAMQKLTDYVITAAFAPVKAKAAGATAFPGMPPETFAALPTRFVASELNTILDGCENCTHRVSELERAGIFLIGDGCRATRSGLAETGVRFILAGNVNGTIIPDSAELLGEPAIENAGTKRSQIWDTVFTSKGTVGRNGLIQRPITTS
ncbi:MAG: hypothetical protein JSS49_23530 [Planctomycetes bacterium]|nr:hypothetical protein [Planctomycetota bacterium]